jgi:cobalt-zinc-cadmium efflux system membrane fusion protein
MKKIIKYTLYTLSGCLMLAGFSSCHTDTDEQDTRQPYVIPDSLMRTLKVDTVKVSPVTDAIKFNGIVDFNADKVANIFPLVSGNVSGITAMPGDYVHAGQVLGVVSSAEVANYNSNLVSDEATVRLTAKQLTQQQEMFKSGLASQVDVTTAEVNYQQAVAAKIAAEKILSINGNNTNGQFAIKTPVSGFIVQKNANNGMAIRPDNNAALFTVSDLQNVWVEANVYEESISKVHEGDEADVTTIAYPDKIFKGKVDKITNVLDPTSKVMKMRVVLDNPGYLLKPQMFATITMYNNENKKAISISSSDLVFDNSQYYVVIYHDQKHIEIRPVTILSTNGKTTYIKSGVNVGEHIIGSDALLIYGSLNN